MSNPRKPLRFKPQTHRSAKQVFGVAWYTEPDWSRVKAAATDADLFEPSFKEWVAMAEEALAEMQKSGVFPEKVHINSNDFLAWCLAHDKENNAAARAEFVSEQLRAKSERGA
jgi:hypothetical protein